MIDRTSREKAKAVVMVKPAQACAAKARRPLELAFRGGLAAVVAACVTGHASAAASMVIVRTDTKDGYGYQDELYFRADPGEANVVTIDWEAPSGPILIRDAGSVVRPGESCVEIDEHTVRCSLRAGDNGTRGLSATRFDLQDGDDEFRNNGHRTPLAVVDGGPGDDRLVGGGGSDTLNGGGGRDHLFGAGGVDELTDGDIDGPAPGAGVDGDRLDGGSGANWISYRQRTEGVDVDLAGAGNNEATGEGDVLVGFHHVIGGRGNDRLAGDERLNVLDGGPGDDYLEARGGRDDLRNGEWSSCGSGVDLLWGHIYNAPSREDHLGLLERDCERFFVNEWYFRPHPKRSRRTLTFPTFTCPIDEADDGLHANERCSVAITVREKAGAQRVLARGGLRGGRWARHPVNVRLTALGRRQLDAQGSEIANIVLRGRNTERRTWSIRM